MFSVSLGGAISSVTNSAGATPDDNAQAVPGGTTPGDWFTGSV